MTPGGQSNSDPYADRVRLAAVEAMLLVRIDDLLAALAVDATLSGGVYAGCCPVHGGDNPGAFNLYTCGDRRDGPFWLCYTRGCQRTFCDSLIGFVRGVLSRMDGWEYGDQKLYPFRKAVDWCCKFLGQNFLTFEVDYAAAEKGRFAFEVAKLAGTSRPPSEKKWSRQEVTSFLQTPSKYFLGRGYSAETLTRYDVGDYPEPRRPLSDRAVAPVYDADGRWVVGFTGRSIHPKCDKCGRWHTPGAPCPEPGSGAWRRSGKWYHHELATTSLFYNHHLAREHIGETGVAVLVEGPGDLWRLVEGGVDVGLGTFGASLSDEQVVMMELSGCINLVIPRDRDAAGAAFEADLKARLGRSFRLHFVELPTHDVGELTPGQVKEIILPLVRRCSW